MALSCRSAENARRILKEVGTNSYDTIPAKLDEEHGRNTIFRSTTAMYEGRQYSDGGVGCIYIYIENMTQAQKDLFLEKRTAVHNTHFIDPVEGTNLTQVGWF